MPVAGLSDQPRAHDLNGNVTQMPFVDDAASTVVMATATYDNRNQMVRYERPGVVAEYRYDPLGRRASKTVTEDTGSTPGPEKVPGPFSAAVTMR